MKSILLLTLLTSVTYSGPKYYNDSISGSAKVELKKSEQPCFHIDAHLRDKLISLFNAKDEEFGKWCVDENGIVRYGHAQVKRLEVLTPLAVYDATAACYASGYVFHDRTTDSFKPRNVQLYYKHNAKVVTDELNGKITVDSKTADRIIYSVDLAMTSNEAMPPFAPTLRGIVIKHSNGEVMFDVHSNNISKVQFDNFTNWWLHCMLPSF